MLCHRLRIFDMACRRQNHLAPIASRNFQQLQQFGVVRQQAGIDLHPDGDLGFQRRLAKSQPPHQQEQIEQPLFQQRQG